MLNIPQTKSTTSNFPKVVKQSDPAPAGLYKAVFKQFITLGFQENDHNGEKSTKFYVNYGFELIEDMMGRKVPKHVRTYDDGSTREDPKFIFREYTLTNDMHHKSNGFTLAKALDPNVPVVLKGKQKEHQYICNFDWNAQLGKTVLVQLEVKESKATGNKYNKLMGVMPLGIPMDSEGAEFYFNLYDSSQEMQDIYEEHVSFFDKKKIKESVPMAGEPVVIYREEAATQPEPEPTPEPKPAVDFDDDIPF